MQSPEITRFEWGTIEIDTGERFKDAKLYPGGARGWDWGETGTQHASGIQPADVEELLAQGADVIILSRGVNEALNIDPKTIRTLEDRGVLFHVLQTEEAVRRYNELRRSRRVGGLFHSTC